jgi:hypothetical protein
LIAAVRALVDVEKTLPDQAKTIYVFVRQMDALFRECAETIDALNDQSTIPGMAAGLDAQRDALADVASRLVACEDERDTYRGALERIRNMTPMDGFDVTWLSREALAENVTRIVDATLPKRPPAAADETERPDARTDA